MITTERKMAPMQLPIIDPSTIAPDGLMRFTDVQAAAGITRGALRTAVEDGLVTPTPARKGTGGRGRPAQTVTIEDALLIIAAAAAAALAGLAFVTMLRALRSAGARVNPAAGGVVLPIPPVRVKP